MSCENGRSDLTHRRDSTCPDLPGGMASAAYHWATGRAQERKQYLARMARNSPSSPAARRLSVLRSTAIMDTGEDWEAGNGNAARRSSA